MRFIDSLLYLWHALLHSAGDQRKHAGWRIPRIDRQRAPLPVIHLDKGKCKEVTIEDVPLIRKKVDKEK